MNRRVWALGFMSALGLAAATFALVQDLATWMVAVATGIAFLFVLLFVRALLRSRAPAAPVLTGYAAVAQAQGWTHEPEASLDVLMDLGAWFLPTRVLVPSEHWNRRPRGHVQDVLRGDIVGLRFTALRLMLADPSDMRREQAFGIFILDAPGPLGPPHERPSRLTIRLAPGGSPPGDWGKVDGEHTLWDWTGRRLIFWNHELPGPPAIVARLEGLASLAN